MVKIALDPAMYHATMSVADELRKAADLGYEYLELSPRADWFFWHRYPKADDAMVAEVNKVVKETGVAHPLAGTGLRLVGPGRAGTSGPGPQLEAAAGDRRRPGRPGDHDRAVR